MKLTDYKYYKLLLTDTPSYASLPKSFREAQHFLNLLQANILQKEKSGRGQLIIVKKQDLFEKFLLKHFPEELSEQATKNANIKALRNSKARKTSSIPVFLLRGFQTIQIAGHLIDLNSYTNRFGLFSIKGQSLNSEKICFVENLESFLRAETLLGEGYVYIHKYGRIGKASLEGITAKEVMVFVDFDFNGMEEYLRIKEVLPQTQMFFPKNFETLFETYSRTLDKEQKLTKRISECREENILLLTSLIQRTNRFLEQEILTND